MLGWCMWQLMHWAVGMARVKAWRTGWPLSFSAPWAASAGAWVASTLCRMVGSAVAVWPSRPIWTGVGLVIPHRVAQIRVQEDVGLVHVAAHALGGRDGAGEGVADRMALLLQCAVAGVGGRMGCHHLVPDGRIRGRRLATAAE